MGRDPEHEPEGRRRGPAERDHRMSAQAGEERARRLVAEPAPRQPCARADRGHSEASGRDRMCREPKDRPEDERDDPVGLAHQRAEQRPVGAAVLAETGCRHGHRSLEKRDPAVIERMCKRRVRVDQRDPVPGEIEAAEERRGRRRPHDRRAHVVDEPRERQLRAAHPAAHGVASLVHDHRATGARQRDRGCQPVRPGADDDGVGRVLASGHPVIFPSVTAIGGAAAPARPRPAAAGGPPPVSCPPGGEWRVVAGARRGGNGRGTNCVEPAASAPVAGRRPPVAGRPRPTRGRGGRTLRGAAHLAGRPAPPGGSHAGARARALRGDGGGAAVRRPGGGHIARSRSIAPGRRGPRPRASRGAASI